MLVFLALGDAKVLSFALGDAKVPDARYFAFWWNIGFTVETKDHQSPPALINLDTNLGPFLLYKRQNPTHPKPLGSNGTL